MRSRGLFAALVILLLLAVSAPALGQESTPAAGAAKPTAIALKEVKFSPQAAVAITNTTVTWTNSDSVDHDVTADDHTWNSPTLHPGEKYTHTFDKPGVYDYYCSLHAQAFGKPLSGMYGRLLVVNSQPALLPGGAAGTNPSEIGVKWLAHWVGLISFIAVFAVMVLYYFVLKYGETAHATDHRDRKEK